MDLKRKFLIDNNIKDNENLIVCFNFECENKIYNLGDVWNDQKIEFWKKDRDSIGVWKIKLLKK
jgi:hypothetical protein